MGGAGRISLPAGRGVDRPAKLPAMPLLPTDPSGGMRACVQQSTDNAGVALSADVGDLDRDGRRGPAQAGVDGLAAGSVRMLGSAPAPKVNGGLQAGGGQAPLRHSPSRNPQSPTPRPAPQLRPARTPDFAISLRPVPGSGESDQGRRRQAWPPVGTPTTLGCPMPNYLAVMTPLLPRSWHGCRRLRATLLGSVLSPGQLTAPTDTD